MGGPEDLNIIMPSDISQSEKDKYHMISLICESNEQNKLTNRIETDSKIQKTDWQLSEGRGDS